MNSRYFLPILSLCILIILPVHRTTAQSESFLDTLLRFTGITATPSGVRGNDGFMEGDIWLVQVGEAEATEPRKITRDGIYHTPLWIPGSQSILAMKGDKLVRLNTRGNEAKTCHTLTDNTALLGFDKNNPDRVLILQESIVGILSLASGQITPLPYDKEKPGDREGLDRLRNDSRDYASVKVSIETQMEPDSQDGYKSSGTIQIKQVGKAISISCPSTCSQPALAEDGRQLLFIGD